jgi:hypothetical protein
MFTKREIAQMLVLETTLEVQNSHIEWILTFTDQKLSDKFFENCGAKLVRVNNNTFAIKY